MKTKTLQLFAVFLTFILLISGISATGLSQKKEHKSLDTLDEEVCSDDFYFVQITDTHVMHKLFDKGENQNKFQTVVNHVSSFEDKPAFVVITGDLVEWGSGVLGVLNFKAFLDCLYEKDDRLYLDSSYSIPVYTIPGNHDYRWFGSLINYHRLVDKDHVKDNDKFTIEYENLTLLFLDTGHDYILRPKNWIHVQGSGLTYWLDILWLENELYNCDSQHKIVLMHYPAINWDKYDTFKRNKEIFIDLVEGYNVNLVLTGHSHAPRVFDKDKNFYSNDDLPLNCSMYPTLHVQTAACKCEVYEDEPDEDIGCYYRNITISGNDVWLNPCEQADIVGE